jgi:hypothetical protein
MEDKKNSTAVTSRTSRSGLLVPRLLCTLVSVTVSGMGVFSMVTEYYYGRTNKLGGAVVVFEGKQAVITGFGMAVFGLFPLALWANNSLRAGIWAACCVITGLSILLFGRLYIH